MTPDAAHARALMDRERVSMNETKKPRPRVRTDTDSQIVGFRIPKPLAKAIKMEAARRKLPLNLLLTEMWELYREAKLAS